MPTHQCLQHRRMRVAVTTATTLQQMMSVISTRHLKNNLCRLPALIVRQQRKMINCLMKPWQS